MPQPDNRRERGAATRATGPGQVAPSGLTMPGGSVSTSSGQAAANINGQVQIGQQGQIKDAGTGLYLALSGLFSGVGEGIKAYEKVYELQSEADYADFDTAYTQEAERVHQDPKKMKVWLDNQSYTPNRITAKKYNTLAARVNEKDYVSYQNDEYIEFQKSIIGHTPDEQLKRTAYMMEMVEEDSPLWNKLREDSLTLESTVSEVARATTLSLYQQKQSIGNQEIKRQLRENSGGTLDYILDTEVFKLMLQANSLLSDEGFSINTMTQTITFNGRSWPLAGINEGTAVELQAELMETLGPILEADLGRAGAVIAASGVSEPRRPGGTPSRTSFHDSETSLTTVQGLLDGSLDVNQLVSIFVGQSSTDADGKATGTTTASFQNLFKAMKDLEPNNATRRASVLNKLGQLLDVDSYPDVLKKLGYLDDNGELNATGALMKRTIDDMFTGEMFNVLGAGTKNNLMILNGSLSVKEANHNSRENQNEMFLALAATDGDSTITYGVFEGLAENYSIKSTNDPSDIPENAFIFQVFIKRDDANVTFEWDQDTGVVVIAGEKNTTTPFPTKHPFVENEDGTYSNVKTITVQFDDDKHYVLPTMVEGKQLSDDDAIKLAQEKGTSNYPSFDTAKEAEEASIRISKREGDKNASEKNPTTKNLQAALRAGAKENEEAMKRLLNREQVMQSHGTQGDIRAGVQSIIDSDHPNRFSVLEDMASLPSRVNDIFAGIGEPDLRPLTNQMRENVVNLREKAPTQGAEEDKEAYQLRVKAYYSKKDKTLNVFRGSPALLEFAVKSFSNERYQEALRDSVSTGALWVDTLNTDIANASDIHTAIAARLEAVADLTEPSPDNINIQRAALYNFLVQSGRPEEWDKNMTDDGVQAAFSEARTSNPIGMDDALALVAKRSSLRLIEEQQRIQVRAGYSPDSMSMVNQAVDFFMQDPTSFIPNSSLSYNKLPTLSKHMSGVGGIPPDLAPQYHVVQSMISALGPDDRAAVQAVLTGIVDGSEGSLEKGFEVLQSVLPWFVPMGVTLSAFMEGLDNLSNRGVEERILLNRVFNPELAVPYSGLNEDEQVMFRRILETIPVTYTYTEQVENENSEGTIIPGTTGQATYEGKVFPNVQMTFTPSVEIFQDPWFWLRKKNQAQFSHKSGVPLSAR